MLTKEETDFMTFWQVNRTKKKNWIWKLSVGLPFSVFLAGSVLVNLLLGKWYLKANEELLIHPSIVLVVLFAMALIIGFILYLSASHAYDINEQRYNELIFKQNKST